MIKAVSNFCVLAAARVWSAFFSYNVWPVFASTTITEAAPVFGIPSDVYSIGSGADAAGVRFAFARALGERAELDLVPEAFRAGLAVAIDSSSVESEIDSTGRAFRTGAEMPLGRTASGSTPF
jgi:hypothetical protein